MLMVSLVANLSFYFCGFVTHIMFINLARIWPGLMEQWNEVDQRMMSYTSSKSKALPRRLKTIAIAIGLSAACNDLQEFN